MRVTSECFSDGGQLPECCAFGSFRAGRLRFGQNLNPDLRWENLPAGARSLALINDDLDVPVGLVPDAWLRGAIGSAPAVRSLCHWLLVDIPPDAAPIELGEFSDGVYAGGKLGPDAPRRMRQGVNEFTEFFAGSGILAGTYFGYDGPCPPPGSPPHRYIFTLYALNVSRLVLPREFRKSDVLSAMQEHVLGTASITGLSAGGTRMTE